MNTLNDRTTRLDRIGEARRDLTSYFGGLGDRYKVHNPNEVNPDRQISVVRIFPGRVRKTRGKHDAALRKDGEVVSARVIFERKEIKGAEVVRVTVHEVLENLVGSREAMRRGETLYRSIYRWVKSKADYLRPEHATDGSPQRRYVMRD